MLSTGLNNRKGIDLSLYLGSVGPHDSCGELASGDSGDRVMRERSGLNGMCLGTSAVRGDMYGLCGS